MSTLEPNVCALYVHFNKEVWGETHTAKQGCCRDSLGRQAAACLLS